MWAVIFALGLSLTQSFVFAGSAGFVAAGVQQMLVKLSGDSRLWNQWEKYCLKQGEWKTEFNEAEIGTKFADDGPKPSQLSKASPILYKQELLNGGRFIDIEMKNPLFSDPNEILKKGRYASQARAGAEQELTRQSMRAFVDLHHLGVKEEEIEIGRQSTAHKQRIEDVMEHIADSISDNVYQRKDWGMFWGFLAGADMHHYINAGLRASTADGAVPPSDAAMGLRSPMSEHPRSFVYAGGTTLTPITYNATQATFSTNIVAALSGVTTAHVPGLDLIRAINRVCVNSNMIPCQLKMNGGGLKNYFLVLIPGSIKDLLESDADYFKLMTESHQGIIDKNPLLKPTDVVYKNLIIRESVKLDNDIFTSKQSFMATGNGTTNLSSSFNLTTVDGVVWADIETGTREFVAASAAATSFGAVDNVHRLKRIVVMGANAAWRATGLEFSMKPMEVTDYGLNWGVGFSNIYGQGRVDVYHPVTGAYSKTPQSFVVHAFAG